ncbi:MAG: hypothetical protein CMJ49_00785 [Planctomycetaceae bacterium]|nr:hypothetical protein [Planctomycetaceae bacterium]
MKTLITGASGYFGRALVHRLTNGNAPAGWDPDELILLGHSEQKADELMRSHIMSVYIGDIGQRSFLEKIFQENRIGRVVHAAAIKYISISNVNPIPTIETNIIGSYNLLQLCKAAGVKEVVGISTDKAINPINVYGLTKKTMEYMFLDSGYTICRGVNFFASSGSVLQIWYNQFQKGAPLTVTDKRCVRYFIGVDDMVDLVIQSMGRNEVINPPEVWEVELGALLEAFMSHYKYDKCKVLGLTDGEKLVEEIDVTSKIVPVDVDTLRELVSREITKWQGLFR